MRRLTRKVALAVSALALSGCAVLNIGNPLWPEGRYLLTAEPNLVNLKYEFSAQAGSLNVTVTEPVFTLRAYPGDAAPGLKVTEYSAEYLDMTGRPVSSLFIARTKLGAGAYLLPQAPNLEANPPLSIALPAYNQQVRLFGQSQVFEYDSQGQIRREAKEFSHLLTCRIKLYGTDDNFNTIEVPFDLPIRFESAITR